MKYRNKILAFAICSTSLICSSCDSKNTLTTDPETRAKALASPQTGDVIRFTSNTNSTLITAIAFTDSIGRTTSGVTSSYQYIKISDYIFQISAEETQDTAQTFRNIVDNLLGGNSSLDTEFREIITHRDTAEFTDAELTRLIAILNASGAALAGDSLDNLVSRAPGLYKLQVTSNEKNKTLGSMGGAYSLDAHTRDVFFSRPTNEEIARYRFLPPNTQIPRVRNTLTPAVNIEQGTWILELAP